MTFVVSTLLFAMTSLAQEMIITQKPTGELVTTCTSNVDIQCWFTGKHYGPNALQLCVGQNYNSAGPTLVAADRNRSCATGVSWSYPYPPYVCGYAGLPCPPWTGPPAYYSLWSSYVGVQHQVALVNITDAATGPDCNTPNCYHVTWQSGWFDVITKSPQCP